jgi:hypothetical protein
MKESGLPRSVAIRLTAHKTEGVYLPMILCEADLSEGLKKRTPWQESLKGILQTCGALTGFSHNLATVPAKESQITRENMAEGARFELADPLRGLRFSRPARSAAPSPLHTKLSRPGALVMERAGMSTLSILLSCDPFHPAHVSLQGLRNQDGTIRLLVVFQNGNKGSTNRKSGPIERVDEFCLAVFLSAGAFASNTCAPRLKPLEIATGGNLPVLVLGRKPDF